MPFDPYDHDLERGTRNRRAMLGDAWVDQSIPNANAFNAEFQNFITRYAWHEVWGRPGLDLKTRRLLVLAVTAALGRWDEFELHCRASLTGGDGATPDSALSADEVKEALMQLAIYAGVPAANTAVAKTVQILRAIEQAPAPRPATDAFHTGVGRPGRRPRRCGPRGLALHRSGTPERQRPRHTVVDEPRPRPGPHDVGRAGEHVGARQPCDRLRPPQPWWLRADQRPLHHRRSGDDAEALLAELDTGPVVWIGLSMGGMTGQELALRHPARVQALVLANTTSGYGEGARDVWMQRIAAVQSQGLDAIADATMARWFTPAFIEHHGAVVARARRRMVGTDVRGYLHSMAAVRDFDTRARLSHIQAPTLVIAGADDPGTPVAMPRCWPKASQAHNSTCWHRPRT